jgi:hypothetical protein
LRNRYEVEAVPALVADLDQRALAIRLDDGPDRSCRPAARVGEELYDIEHSVRRSWHT